MENQKESKQESKIGFPRCTFRTNLAIGFCVSFVVVALVVFGLGFPINAEGFILKKIAIVLGWGTINAFHLGGHIWFFFDWI